jgi:protein-disulfide isomerase
LPQTDNRPNATPGGGAGTRRILAVGALVLAVVGFGAAAAFFFANQGERIVVAPTVRPNTSPTVKPGSRVERIKGNPDAKVTVLEYSDFQCPFCVMYFNQTYRQVDERYVKTGKVRYIFRSLPIASLHPQAQKASEAAECAGDQGKFWEMHDLLFGKQSEWAGKPTAMDVFKGYAKSLGLDEGRFQACLDSGLYAGLMIENARAAQAVGITGTPAFVIGNRLLPGAYPIEAFVQVIEEELAKQK